MVAEGTAGGRPRELATVVLVAVAVVCVEPTRVLVPPGWRMWLRGIRSSSSLAGSWISALISCTACRVDSVPPLGNGDEKKTKIVK